MSKDYYKILGIDKSASAEEIKKAFRKLAHQHHPDKKGGDEKKFKEINEAYQVLGDQKKRAQYDQFGSAFEHAQAGGGFSGFDGFRDFSGYANGFSQDKSGFSFNMGDLGDVFGDIGDIFGFSSRASRSNGRGRASARGEDIQVQLNIEFKEAVFGAEKEINLRKKVVCDKCQGSCAEPGSKIETCKTCGGSGKTTKVQRTIFGNMQVQMACQDCRGEGKKIKEPCKNCSGTGVCEKITNLKIKIPAGINNNETIRLSGQGEAGEKGGQAGDLYLIIKVNLDKRFIREGYEIKSEATISFTQAAIGAKIEVETVDGPVKLKIPEGTESGTVFNLRGRGVTHLQGRGRGDHLVKVKIKTPKNLNRKQKKMLEELGL